MKKPHRFEIIRRKINLKSLAIQRCNEYICESKYRFEKFCYSRISEGILSSLCFQGKTTTTTTKK